MRQGGMKPKGHNSGVYWVRATGSNKKTKHEPKKGEDTHFLDDNNDGEIDGWEVSRFVCTWIGVIAVIGWLFWLEYS
jgi:hypothetical protein